MSDGNFKVTWKPKDISPDSIAEGLAKVFMNLYGRSFTCVVSKVDGKIHILATEQATDSEVWTVHDVAAYTQQMSDKVLRWCQTRARQQAKREGRTPIPFRKQDAKTLLFSRREVMEWWDNAEPPVVATFTKGKVKKGK